MNSQWEKYQAGKEDRRERKAWRQKELAAGRSGIRAKSERGKELAATDSEVYDSVMMRDNGMCVLSRLFDGKAVQADCAHHIARKKTHRGAAVRNDPAYAVAISNHYHRLIHDGHVKDEAILDGNRVTQRFTKFGVTKERTVFSNPIIDEE
jgi:hypothetical protein